MRLSPQVFQFQLVAALGRKHKEGRKFRPCSPRDCSRRFDRRAYNAGLGGVQGFGLVRLEVAANGRIGPNLPIFCNAAKGCFDISSLLQVVFSGIDVGWLLHSCALTALLAKQQYH